MRRPFLALTVCAALFLLRCSSSKDGPTPSQAGQPALTYPGCEDAGVEGLVPGGATHPDAGTSTPSAPPADEAALFGTRVEPELTACRVCHTAGATADVDGGRGLLFGADPATAREDLRAAWTALGKGVETSPLLTKGANTDSKPHSGGAAWPEGSAAYADVKALLGCWNDPASCPGLLAALGSESAGKLEPLLGDLEATGGRNYAAVYCAGKPDCATLPMDPRELIAGDNLDNPSYAVYFNDPFEICVNDTLLATQAKQNELLAAQGQPPVYTAKPRPKTCGEWRAAVDHGREYILTTPITGAVITVESLVNLATYLGYPVPADVDGMNAALGAVAQERYGWPASPYRNPAPLPGEDPNATDGGSLQLPLAMAQVKDDDGKWTGKLGMTCFACHVGQIGTGEVVGNSALRDHHPELYGGAPNGIFLGLNGSNTDAALAFYDTEQANGKTGPNAFDAILANPSYLAGRTRGTNAADQEIVMLLTGRNFDTLDWTAPSFMPMNGGKDVQPLLPPSATGGDQDIPTWWWTHNKSRYLWVGFGSSGSSRGNFFPASTNPNDGHWSKRREGDFQDLDMWLNTVEAPKFVGPDIDVSLAEQGAILFHSKDLWADPGNSDIPRPGGNGSCAGCHGAYSPRYIHQKGFLPDPRLAGMSGYTVPLSVLGTDPSQSGLYSLFPASDRKAADGLGNSLWMSYPDAQEGYVTPEERKTPFDPTTTIKGQLPSRTCGLGALGGYSAQPLHGVWASGPYFHNGSVPTVWDVLKPSDRPEIWRRQQIPASEAAPDGSRGYDTRLDRAYDYTRLGWKYEAFVCDPKDGAPYGMSCAENHDVTAPPSKTPVDDRTLYNTHAFSKSNRGHEYTKVLTDDERRALVEYLKTL